MPAVCKTKFIQSHLKPSQQHQKGKTELSYCKKERPRPGWAGFARGKGWGSKCTSQKPAVAFRCCYSSSLTQTLGNSSWWTSALQIQRNNQNTVAAYDHPHSSVPSFLLLEFSVGTSSQETGDVTAHCDTVTHTAYSRVSLTSFYSYSPPLTSYQSSTAQKSSTRSKNKGIQWM